MATRDHRRPRVLRVRTAQFFNELVALPSRKEGRGVIMSEATVEDLLSTLRDIVERTYVLTGDATDRYRKGRRSCEGAAAAVVRPGTLIEMWRCLKACVDGDTIIIIQAANTGLTEGSAPKGQYDRPVVIFSTLRLDRIYLLADGKQIVGLPGGTLYKLEEMLDPLGRQPRSAIGSSCIGASIHGGVCNNSGRALVRPTPNRPSKRNARKTGR